MRISDQEANRLRVLKEIRRAEPVARTELAARTGLPTQAISDIVADLVSRNLLIEEQCAAGGRGRPRIAVRINAAAVKVVGAYLFPGNTLAVHIADLRGESMFRASFAVAPVQSVEALADAVATQIANAIASSGLAGADIHSVGIGLPAIVDSAGGILHWLPGFPAAPYPFAARIAAALRLPVSIDSAPDVLSRAEHWFGEDRQVDDFALIFVGYGIGLGQYVDGVLRSGDHGVSPALAHMKMTLGDGPACLCGARGCLMTYASVSGLVVRISEIREMSRPTFGEMHDLLRIFAAEAQAGDRGAAQAFAQAGTALGTAIANYINVWDPARLIVQVQDPVFCEMIGPHLFAAVHANTLSPLRDRARVELRISEELNFSRGTAALVIERLYRGRRAPVGSVERAA